MIMYFKLIKKKKSQQCGLVKEQFFAAALAYLLNLPIFSPLP